MCQQCMSEALTYGEFLPGFSLQVATKDAHDWKTGEYGLVECNDPTFVLATTPMRDPSADLDDDDESDPEDDAAYWAAVSSLDDGLYGSVEQGHRLYSACLAAGYDPLETPRLAIWLLDRMADLTEGVEPIPHEDEGAARFDGYEEAAVARLRLNASSDPGWVRSVFRFGRPRMYAVERDDAVLASPISDHPELDVSGLPPFDPADLHRAVWSVEELFTGEDLA